MQFKKPFLANLKRRTSNFILYIQILALIGVFLIILLGQVNVSTISSRLTDWYMLIVKPLTLLDYATVNKAKKIKELLAENTILKKQLAELDFIRLENKKIKALSNYHVLHGFRYITTRAFLNVANDLHELCFLDAGYLDGVKKYSAVINADGLVGMVIEVGKHWSRMISIFDRLFKIPVICVQSNIEAIISGTSQKITFGILSEDKKLLPNDKVITSGRCGHFPPGILVGTISNNKLEASVNFKTVDYVLIITKIIDSKNNNFYQSATGNNTGAPNPSTLKTLEMPPKSDKTTKDTATSNNTGAPNPSTPKTLETRPSAEKTAKDTATGNNTGAPNSSTLKTLEMPPKADKTTKDTATGNNAGAPNPSTPKTLEMPPKADKTAKDPATGNNAGAQNPSTPKTLETRPSAEKTAKDTATGNSTAPQNPSTPKTLEMPPQATETTEDTYTH